MLLRKWYCVLLLGAVSCIAKAELLPYPIDTINGKLAYRYVVPRSIGLYRISVNFGVSQEDIVQWNPQLKERGLHYAETIHIPVKESDIASLKAETVPEPISTASVSVDSVPGAVDSVTTVEAAVQDSVAVVQDSVAVMPDSMAVVAKDSIKTRKVALLLPLQADIRQREPSMDRFTDFYAGVLIALSEVKDSASRYELFVYDTGKSEGVIEQMAADSVLRGMDAIIGPAYPAQVEVLSEAAKADSIPMFIPFTSKVKHIESNPFLFQFNPDVKNEARALANYLETKKDSVNCVFVDAIEADIPYSIREFRQAVRNREINVSLISVHEIMVDSLSKALKDSVENIIVFNSEKFSNLQLLLPHVISGKDGKSVTLYSQYSWQKEKIILPQLYTSVFATELPADLTHYNTEYALYFKKEPVSDMPRFDLLGYDITRQMMAWLEGKEYYGLQSDMRFEKVSEEGGYINTNVRVIRVQ